MDALSADVSYKFISGTPYEESTIIATLIVDNIHFERALSSEHDLILSCYPIKTGNTTISLRTDVH
jgi:hypothetical protein